LGWSKFYRNYRFLRYLAATYLINWE
jgi:hypothetical protein